MAQKVKAPSKATGWSQLRALLPYLRRYWVALVVGLGGLALMGLIGALPQILIGTITDCLNGAPRALANLTGISRHLVGFLFVNYQPRQRHVLVFYCLLLIGAVAIKGVCSFWSRWVLIGISRDIEFDLRNDVLSRLVGMEPEFYFRNRTGELMSRCTNDLNNVRMVLGPGIMYSATTIVTMILAVYFMFELSPSLTLWVLVPVPFVAYVVKRFGVVIHRLSEKIQATLAQLSARAQENLAGVRVLRAYAQENAEINAFDETNREYVSQNMLLVRTWSLFFPSLQGLMGAAFLIVLWEGGREVMVHKITLGTLLAFFAFMVQLVFPMVALGWVTNIFQRGAASMGRLRYILEARPNIDDSGVITLPRLPGPPPSKHSSFSGSGNRHGRDSGRPAILGGIEFRDLTFSYPAFDDGAIQAPALSDINLRVPVGSTLAIVGPTGSGKSTLAGLITRLWEVPEGTLLIDGRPIRQFPLGELRRSIGFVPQDSFLFSATVGDNIAFGAPDATQSQVEEAAEIAGVDGDILAFPNGYATLVGERGITLSGGQKQRTALARAIIRQPRILIMDDSLSSVDTETEDRILGRLKAVMGKRTTILISHRCSTVRNADQIVVLREGRIIERGTHAELLAAAGYYADLHEKQLLEEELARE
jgi:ATP-binding cassette subfamily B multidrug efflux pump